MGISGMITPKPSRSMKTMKKMMRSAPLGGEEAGGRASALDMAVRLHGGRLRCDIANRLNEAFEAEGLLFQALDNGGVGEISRGVEFVLHARDEDAIRISVGIAIAKDQLELLDGAQAAPDAIGFADECHGLAVEAFGELEHVDEIFEHAGKR